MHLATSEEDDKQRVRREIVRSFLYGECAYVALLNSLVQVTFHVFFAVLLTPILTSESWCKECNIPFPMVSRNDEALLYLYKVTGTSLRFCKPKLVSRPRRNGTSGASFPGSNGLTLLSQTAPGLSECVLLCMYCSIDLK